MSDKTFTADAPHTLERIREMRRANGRDPEHGDPGEDRDWRVYCTDCGTGYDQHVEGKPCFRSHLTDPFEMCCPGTFRTPEVEA